MGSGTKGSDMITKCLRFSPEVVTCLNCLCNYPSNDSDKPYGSWCQVWSFVIEDDDKFQHTNRFRANTCKQWIPREFDRSNTAGEEDVPDRWYEKDSMA